MSRDTDSTEASVLRRIHKNHLKTRVPIEVGPEAFRPNANDAEGLSVSFADQVTPEELVDQARKDPGDYGVVSLSVTDLDTLGLTVVPDRSDDAPRGHAFLRELNHADYSDRSQKRRLKALTVELARLATKSIVLRPTNE